MKKIPTLFVRDRTTHLVTPEVTPGCEWVREPGAVPTAKWDGTACLFHGGAWYKRHTVRAGKSAPPTFMPAQPEPDPNTGEWPGWVPVEPTDRWHRAAITRIAGPVTVSTGGQGRSTTCAGNTWELCGPHVNGNPHKLAEDVLIQHGAHVLSAPTPPTDFEGLRAYLATCPYEGIVWWRNGAPGAKIKRRDVGLPWPPLTTCSP